MENINIDDMRVISFEITKYPVGLLLGYSLSDSGREDLFSFFHYVIEDKEEKK